MNKEEAREFILSKNDVLDFVKNENSHIDFILNKIPITIYKEGIGVRYYYQSPYVKGCNYQLVSDFLNHAIPVLSEMVEAERSKKINKTTIS